MKPAAAMIGWSLNDQGARSVTVKRIELHGLHGDFPASTFGNTH